jgi:hypothetical protein
MKYFFGTRSGNFGPKTEHALRYPTKVSREISSGMSFYLILVLSVCGGSWFADIGKPPIFKSIIIFLALFI